jgi:glyoxylase-like metal-dependent hydrolase (beta-lactamase superfamily II)
MSDEPRFYFRQLLSGQDFARTNQMAHQMVNFTYLIGDRATGEAMVVDPAYDIDGLLEVLEADEMRLVGALATHYHADHVGGLEAVFTVLALHHQKSPPTINIFNQDPECDLDYCANTARDLKIDIAVKNNFGFGGTNGTLVFKRL